MNGDGIVEPRLDDNVSLALLNCSGAQFVVLRDTDWPAMIMNKCGESGHLVRMK